jgi:hypothetical protein
LPSNITSFNLDLFKKSISEVVNDSNSGFPSISLTTLGDYLKNNEAAACNLSVPDWSSAIFWQAVTAAITIFFMTL